MQVAPRRVRRSWARTVPQRGRRRPTSIVDERVEATRDKHPPPGEELLACIHGCHEAGSDLKEVEDLWLASTMLT